MEGQGTGPVNVYEVLRDQINQVRDDTKELRRALEERTKQGDCNRRHAKLGKRFDEIRQELATLESDIVERVELVEGALEEANAMTREVVQEAVALELRKANGHMKDAVVEELRKAKDKPFWPKTLNDTLRTLMVIAALVGLAYTLLHGYGDSRIAEQKQQETIAKMEAIVDQMQKAPTPVPKP